jgi:hypothetical protein
VTQLIIDAPHEAGELIIVGHAPQQSQITHHPRLDHHGDRARDKRKMILWQSPHVEVNSCNRGRATASGDNDQHEVLPGHKSMISSDFRVGGGGHL